ncbi:MAG: hypothetical protein FWC40_06525 [Proteobacteria bacterium]|nr:hypothetical protein [Pseudomonadota bacterium]
MISPLRVLNCLVLTCFIGILPPFAAICLGQENSLDERLERHWTTQPVPALTSAPLFQKAGQFQIGLSFGYVPNDAYHNYFPFMLDLHYHLTQEWVLGLRGSMLLARSDTSLSRFLTSHQPTLDIRQLGDTQLGDVFFLASYRPLYGKWAMQTTHLGHFDWGVFLGIGSIIAQSPNAMRTSTQTKARVAGIVGMDAHLSLTSWLALRLEASMRMYQAHQGFLLPCTLALGVSFFFPQAAND